MVHCNVYRQAFLLLFFLSATLARLGDIVPSSAFRLARRNVSTESACHLAATFQARGGGNGETVKSNPWLNFVSIIRDSRRDLAAAAAARCSSIFTMYPVDTLKTRLQMEQSNPFRLEGMYKGLVGSLIGQVPYGVLTFGSYEMYKKALLNRFPNTKPVLLYAFSAVLGDLTGSGWLCPSEVIKQQTQAGMYKSTAEAFRGILSKKGIKGLYEGYFGGIARDVPFRVAQLTSYEVTKNFYLRIKSQRMKSKSNSEKGKPKIEKVVLSPHEAAFCGAVAGTFSAAITAPLDRFKTLLMTDSAAYGGTVLSCAAKIWREEGIAGFATGIVPRVSYIAPSVAIFFIVYEQVRQRLDY